MNEQEVLHNFAVAQNRGSAFARFLRLIRFSHTIFALPFALAALVVAANGRPQPQDLAVGVGMHGHRPNRSDALQPFGRLGNRSAQSEDRDPASSRDQARRVHFACR